ncbi:serine/threonine protein kinase [Streptomyces sp. NPDC087917]|uniref:serine/threonine-protein kinase n=1 Tax=Streptomyces sp. NPDC087917 TaxID=3155060 RepID=UPI003445F1EF
MLDLTGSGAEPLEAGDPRRIGPIPLAGRLGAGGMGRVYLGLHEGRYVAVKQLLASVVGEDEDFLRRFGHELDNLARLPEGATVPLLGSDRDARPPWFATAYVPGLTLKEAVTLHGGGLPASALWLLLREAAAALTAVHALDMVHRDLKPSNVMLTLDGLTLIDFGVARAAEQSQLTRTGMVVGTPAYMAPEQASGKREVGGAADVFALGSVLAYAACGRPPFGDESGHGVLYRIVHEEPDLEPLRELDPELADLVADCLGKEPSERPTATDLLERTRVRRPFAAPLWPEAVTGRLSERAAFAADVQEVDVPTLPLTAAAAEPEAAPPKPTEPVAEPRPERRRRTRVLLAVIPVVVIASGTTLAIQHIPFTSSPPPSAAHGAPSASGSGSASAPGGPAPSAVSGSPSGPAAASPGQSPAGGAVGAGETGGPQNAAAGGVAGGPAGTSTGSGNGGSGNGGGDGGAQNGSNGNNGANGAAASGSSAGSTRNPSGGGSTTVAPPAPPPASGAQRFRNGDTGKCITQVFGASDSGDCADSTAKWTVQGRSDGSFKLVNQQTRQCLYANGLGQAAFVGDCAQDIGRLWRTGSGGSLRSEYGGGCLDLAMSSGLVTSQCAGDASQRWTGQA